jgi:hypothetical protein
LLSTNYLRSTGLLDAYESTVETMISDGWPADTSIFDHAAYLILRWQVDNQDVITIQAAAYRKKALMNPKRVVSEASALDGKSKKIGGLNADAPKGFEKKMDPLKRENMKTQDGKLKLKSKKMYNFEINKIDTGIFGVKDDDGNNILIDNNHSMKFVNTMPEKQEFKKVELDPEALILNPLRPPKEYDEIAE